MSTEIVPAAPKKGATPLTPALRHTLDAAADALIARWQEVQASLLAMAEIAMRLLAEHPDVLDARGEAMGYLVARLERKGMSRRRLYDVIEAARVRAEVLALPGPCPAMEALTVDQARALKPVLPAERERWAKDIRSQSLTAREIQARLVADGVVEGTKEPSRGETRLRGAWRHLRVRITALDALDAGRRAKAIRDLTALQAEVARRLERLGMRG